MSRLAIFLALVLWPVMAVAQGFPPYAPDVNGSLHAVQPAAPIGSAASAMGQGSSATPSNTQAVQGVSGGTPLPTLLSTPSYTVLPAASSATGPLTLTQSGSYVWDTRGSYAGALETLKQAGADGSLVTVASKSSPGATCVVLTTPQGSTTPNTQDQLSGATGTPSLTSTLTYAPQGCGGGLPTTVNGVTPNFAASGATFTPVALTAPGQSASFTPVAGRLAHVYLLGSGSGSCQLQRQLDGTNWTGITATAAGSTTILYNWSYAGVPLGEDFTEAQAGVPYRVNCTSVSGSVTPGFSQ